MHYDEFAHFKDGVENYSQDSDEKSDHIQTVVLVPGKVVGLDTQVFSTFTTHNKLNPEHSLIQRLYWSVMMNPGQTHSVLFIPEEKTNTVICPCMLSAIENMEPSRYLA